MEPESPGGPKISLEQLSTDRNGAPGCWRIEWRIKNGSSQSIHVRSVRLPHGQFKSEEQGFDPPIDLRAGQEGQFQTRVHSNEPPGLITENAFVIFHVTWLDELWRVFVRLRVMMTEDHRPETATERVTTQKVGFSGVAL